MEKEENAPVTDDLPVLYAGVTAAELKRQCLHGTLPLFPLANPAHGLVDTSPVYDILDAVGREFGTVQTHSNVIGQNGKLEPYEKFTEKSILTLLMFKAHQSNYGFSSGEYISRKEAHKAGFTPCKDSCSCDLIFTKKDTNGNFHTNIVQMLNIEQFPDPSAVRQFAAESLSVGKSGTDRSQAVQKTDSLKAPIKPEKHTVHGTSIIFGVPSGNAEFASDYLAHYCACVREHVYMQVSSDDVENFRLSFIRELARNGRRESLNFLALCALSADKADVLSRAVNDALKTKRTIVVPSVTQTNEKWHGKYVRSL
jgi:hypothetical protein